MSDKQGKSVKSKRGDGSEKKTHVSHGRGEPTTDEASTSTNARSHIGSSTGTCSRSIPFVRPHEQAVNVAGSTDQSRIQQKMTGSTARIKRELSDIMESPPPNCQAQMHNDDLYRWSAILEGPEGTVYEGGHFELDIRFPIAYPFQPPRIRFSTRIYHCNVDSRGAICLDVLSERWSPVMTIAKVLLSIWLLLGECNPEDPLVMGIADQYKCNRKEHDQMARKWTKRYATPKEVEEQREESNADNKPKVEDEPSTAYNETLTLTLPTLPSANQD